MKYIIKTTSLFIFLFFTTYSYAEKFRVGNVYMYAIEEGGYPTASFSIGYNDAISLQIQKDLLFLNGIELQIKQDKTALANSNMISYEIYSHISPVPKKKCIDYSGKRLFTNLLPTRITHTIQIPLKKTYTETQKNTSDTVPYDKHIMEYPILFRLHPVMKGIPDSLENAVFTITVKPIVRNEGGLKINLTYPKEEEQKPVNVQIDNHYLNNFSDLQIIAPGTYRITVSSDEYRSEVRSCIIEKGKITTIPITLKSTIPLLDIDVPSKVTVLFDNETITIPNTPIPITTGTHTITVKIGEYEAVRQFTAEKGKSYLFNMNIDTSLTELK